MLSARQVYLCTRFGNKLNPYLFKDHEITAFIEIPKITSSSSVYVPKVYHTDFEHHVLIMEDCGQGSTDLKEYLRHKSLPLDTARRIGHDLGQFLAEIHLTSHESQALDSFPVQLKNTFAKNHAGRAFSARITYGVILDESRLPPTFPNVDEIRALAQAAQDRFMSTNEVLVMGDFSPRNMLVHGEMVERVGIVDWEFVRPGFPGADIGEFMAELYALRKFYPWCSEAVETLGSAFITRYKSVISSNKSMKLDEIAKAALLHAGAQLFGVTRFAQPKWGSDEEIQQISLEGLDIILTGNVGVEWYSKCLLDSLLL